jgi:hypothetical protein
MSPEPGQKKGHHFRDAPAVVRATRLPSNSRLPAVNIQAARTMPLSKGRTAVFPRIFAQMAVTPAAKATGAITILSRTDESECRVRGAMCDVREARSARFEVRGPRSEVRGPHRRLARAPARGCCLACGTVAAMIPDTHLGPRASHLAPRTSARAPRASRLDTYVHRHQLRHG